MRFQLRRLVEPLVWYGLFTVIYIVAFREPLFSATTYTAVNLTLPVPQPFPTFGSFLGSLFSSWSPSVLGYPNLNVAPSLYFNSFQMLFSFNNQLIAEKVLGLSTFVAFFTMYFLLRNHFTKSRPARFAGALLYSLNPLTISLSPPLWGYALFPLAANYLLNIVLDEERRTRDSVLLGFFAALAVASYFYYVSFLLIVGIVYFAASVVSFRSLARLLTQLRLILISLAVFIALMFSYIWTYYEQYFVTYAAPTVQTAQNWYSGWTPLNALMLFVSGVRPENVLLAGMVLILFCTFPLLFIRRFNAIKDRITLFSSFFFVIFIVLFGLLASSPTALFLTLYGYLSIVLAPLASPPGASLLIAFSYACLLTISVDMLASKTRIGRVPLPRVGAISAKKAGAVFVLIVLFVPYLSSYPILNAPAMTYTNPSSMTSIYDFLQQHGGSNGSYRYYVLPLDTQTEENAYSFPGLFAAQEPALPASLEYGRFIDYLIVNNLTTHLGSLLSLGNVKYLFVDKVLQHWIPPDQASYYGRYGAPRIVGYSWGVWGDWRAFSQILNDQVDLKLVANESDFLAYENTAYVPMVNVFGNMTLVVGDMRALLPMVDKLGFNTSTSLVTYADQNTGPVDATLLNDSSTVVFYDSTIDDLVLDTLVNQFGIPSSNLKCSGCTVGQTYLPLEDSLFYSFFGFTDNSGYTNMGINSQIIMTFNANQSSNYQIWVRPFFSPSAGQLQLSAGGENYNLSLTSPGDLGFKWVRIATLQLTEGTHTFALSNEGNETYLDWIAVVPGKTMSLTSSSISDALRGKRTMTILDSASNEFNVQTTYNPTRQIAIQSLQGWSAYPNQPLSISAPTQQTSGTITVNGTLDRICNSCIGGQIVAGYSLPSAEDWNSYDYLSFSVKPTVSTLYVALSNSSFVQEEQGFAVTPNVWNTVRVPLVNASYASVMKIDFIGEAGTPGILGQMTIGNISLGKSLSALSLPLLLGAQANYSVYFATASRNDNATISLETGGHQFNATSIGNGVYGPIPSGPSPRNATLVIFSTAKPTLLVVSNGYGLPFSNSEGSVAYSVMTVTNPSSTMKYVITTDPNDTEFVYLGQSYYPDWRAVADDVTLTHFVAYGFANGYVMNDSLGVQVGLEDNLQVTRNLLVLSSLIPLIVIVAYLAYDFGRKPWSKHFGRPQVREHLDEPNASVVILPVDVEPSFDVG